MWLILLLLVVWLPSQVVAQSHGLEDSTPTQRILVAEVLERALTAAKPLFSAVDSAFVRQLPDLPDLTPTESGEVVLGVEADTLLIDFKLEPFGRFSQTRGRVRVPRASRAVCQIVYEGIVDFGSARVDSIRVMLGGVHSAFQRCVVN